MATSSPPTVYPVAVFGVPCEHVIDEQVDVEDQACRQAMRLEVLRLVAQLPRREMACIVLRYGLAGRRPHSLREISDLLSISLGSAFNLERQAIQRMRDAWEL